jgi:hypothetical protein
LRLEESKILVFDYLWLISVLYFNYGHFVSSIPLYGNVSQNILMMQLKCSSIPFAKTCFSNDKNSDSMLREQRTTKSNENISVDKLIYLYLTHIKILCSLINMQMLSKLLSFSKETLLPGINASCINWWKIFEVFEIH